MSAIGSVQVIDSSALPDLEALLGAFTPAAWSRFLRRHSLRELVYGASGQLLGTLLPYLQGRGVDLLRSEHQALAARLSGSLEGTCAILTPTQQRWLPELADAHFTEAQLAACYQDLNGTQAPGIGRPMLEGVRFFRDALAALDASTVGLLSIG